MPTLSSIKQRTGFGLLEVLMATAIFIVVVGSMVTLSQVSVRNSVIANHRTQAYNLAEDALEGVRQIRDTNWLLGPSVPGTIDSSNRWLAMVNTNCSEESTPSNPTGEINNYQVAQVNQAYELCYFKGLSRFALKPHSGVEVLAAGTAPDPGSPKFKQVITFEPVADGDLKLLGPDANNQPLVMGNIESIHARKIKVTVTWKDFDKDWSINMSTILTNWKAR
jgi:type II secretory pathway pseudopilin PulG